MALNFPISPSVNQIYVDSTSGFVYQWDGVVWKNYVTSNPKNIVELDNISTSFNGVTTTFALTVNSSPITPSVDDQLIINIGGITQNSGTDYTVSGSNITFTTAPTSGLTFNGFVFGGGVPLPTGDVGSGTVGPYSLTTGGPVWDSAGNITITGIATIGSSSVTINGSTNRITIGTGSTVSSTGITAGIITATLVGSGANLSGVGIGTTGSINTSGIITAASFYGDGSGLTNIGGLLEPLVYNPGIAATGIAATTNIILTYQKPIVANVGIVTIQTAELTYNQTLTAADSSNYTVTGNDRSGNVSGTDPAITVKVGDTIVFNNTVSGSHPLYIRVSNGGASVTQGTLTGEGTATTTWDTFGVTPGTYYYQCGVHASMIGQIIVQDNVSERFDVSTVGSSSSISISNAELTINPSTNLAIGGTSYYVIFPEGAIRDTMRTSNSVGITSYYFETAAGVAGTAYGYYVSGNSSSGILGLNDAVNRSSPTQVPGTTWSLTAFKETDGFSGSTGNGAVTQNGELYTWGLNTAGLLGMNDTVRRSSPTQVPGTQWKNCYIGPYSAFATKTDGTAWCWGSGASFPINSEVYRSSPTQIPGTQWSFVRSTIARNGGYGFKTDNTIWLWGNAGFGDFGNNGVTTVPTSSPIQIPGTQWYDFSANQYVIGGVKTDGTLWVWGYETSGSHGDNGAPNVPRSSPYQIPGTQWSSFSAGYHCIATKTDGTLWSWGYNGFGGSGLNDAVPRSSPHQIPGTQWTITPREKIDSNNSRSSAFKTDNTLWVWGRNINGELGINDVNIHRSSPVQIPGTQWKTINFGDSHTFIIKEL